MSGLDVVPSSVSAEVTWLGAGSTAKEYLVAAIPQTLVKGLQPPIDWKTVPATPDCGTVTTTVTGLTAGTKYIFWLRMVTVDPIYGGSHDTWVARSLVITAG